MPKHIALYRKECWVRSSFFLTCLRRTNFILMSEEILNLQGRVATLETALTTVVNDMEELFYSLLSSRSNKKTIEEVVEMAVIEYFSLNRKDFLGKTFLKWGRPRNGPTEDTNIIEGRKWFMCITRHIFLRGPHQIRSSYPFYAEVKEFKHRKAFLGAMEPKTQKDQDNRIILLGVSAIIKRICLEEGVLDERLDML